MLYGLGVGFGKDPLNNEELKFVYERDLKTAPSMATVISWGAGNMRKWNKLFTCFTWRAKIKNV